MKILKSIGAILAGIIFIVVTHTATDFILESLGVFPPPPNRDAPSQRFDVPWMVSTALGYRIFFQIAGGYLTAYLAPSRPVLHSVILGLVGLVMSTAAAIAVIPLDWGPAWYPIALAVSALPSVWFGGWLASRRLSERQPA
jgi:hypothetical protein